MTAGDSGTKSDTKDPSAIAKVARVLEPEGRAESATVDLKSDKSDAEEKEVKVLESDGSIDDATGEDKSANEAVEQDKSTPMLDKDKHKKGKKDVDKEEK